LVILRKRYKKDKNKNIEKKGYYDDEFEIFLALVFQQAKTKQDRNQFKRVE